MERPQTRLDEPALYDGVLSRRVFAFIFDWTVVAVLSLVAGVLVFFLGILTLGLAWLLYGAIFPLVGLVYTAFTLGGSSQATPGMQIFGLKIERLDGKPLDPLWGALHSVLFWTGNIFLTPFILLIALFTNRKQTGHDLLLGTVVVRNLR
ncbi:RDD family protein [Notoacmeibacter ruber]|uniref:RDD family protein n=1 Tax=Notoacmeibacter ruber TaxID=2670375 RepID=A0A3L7JGB0_9HYPH|nr:RDD family protein [Notoacmeibacter ruber]RLQ89355.1 RDD family protein [Notoacmeibacter ruber]